MTSPSSADADVDESPLCRLADHGGTWLLSGGVVAVVVGILALVWPGLTVLVTAMFFGAYLLVNGTTQRGLSLRPAAWS